MWKRHLPKASAVFERQALFGVDIEVETFGFAIARACHFWQHANICNVQTLPISHAKTNPGIRRKCFCIVVPCQTGLHCLRSLQVGRMLMFPPVSAIQQTAKMETIASAVQLVVVPFGGKVLA